MAYMHELGHTNYLHHAMQGNCPYCDATCLMVRAQLPIPLPHSSILSN
jgi:hypothetical protein